MAVGKHVPPSIKLRSFSCPRCGAHADQTWFITYTSIIDSQSGLPMLSTEAIVEKLRGEARALRTKGKLEEAEAHTRAHKLFERALLGETFLHSLAEGTYCTNLLSNIHVSKCFSCKDVTIWLYDQILYPRRRYEIEPNADMDEDIKADFEEAREVLDVSPRSAAALLRLCIQKLCKQAGEPGKNINQDIGSLVKKGLKPQIQMALDTVRVVGNNAVHPGALDLKDDRDTAAKLFELVNRIAYDMITHPREIEALFGEKLTEGQKAEIAKRDTGN